MYDIGISIPYDMEFDMHKIGAIFCVSMLVACSTAPKPPTLDGISRKAVNTSETASMWYIQSDLIEIKHRLRELEQQISVNQKTSSSSVSSTVIVHFPYNSSRFRLTKAKEIELLSLLANALRVEIRGRTDSEWPSSGDALIALNRAKSAKKYLISRGVPAGNISINYLSGGDHISEGGTDIGRMKNRRVEIEIFYQ
jgi:traP protein